MALGRPVLRQLLVPKIACENGEKSSALTRRPRGLLPQTEDEVQVSTNAARPWIILPHRQK